jgi:hypothetical protein
MPPRRATRRPLDGGPCPARPAGRHPRPVQDRGGQGRARAGGLRPGAAAGGVAAIYRELGLARGVPVRTEILLQALPRVSGDPTRLRQVVTNLLGNALKFTSAGTVTLRAEPVARPDGDSAPLDPRVGAGLRHRHDAEQKAQLFQRFTQADSSTTRRFGGSGLGLVICKHLVELMGGSIHADSAPGQGSTFWFELPLEAALGPVPTPDASTAHRGHRRAERLRAAPGAAPRARGRHRAFCALADALLIAAGVLGMAQALGTSPGWPRAGGRRRAVPGGLRLRALRGRGSRARWRRPRARRRCRAARAGAGRRLHAAQPACLPGHRAAGGQHRRAAAGALRAGSSPAPPPPAWCGSRRWASARAGWRRVRAAARLAGAGRPDRR